MVLVREVLPILLVLLPCMSGLERIACSQDEYEIPQFFHLEVPAGSYTENTFCMWYRTSNIVPGRHTLFSYIYFDESLRRIVNLDYVASALTRRVLLLTATLGSTEILEETSINFLRYMEWKMHCMVVTFNPAQKILEQSWYVKHNDRFELILNSRVSSEEGIRGGGRLVLLQGQYENEEQKLEIFYSYAQAKMGLFNWWNRTMTVEELNGLTCDSTGNIANMAMFEERGSATCSGLIPC